MPGLLTADLHIHPHKALSTIVDGMNSRLLDGLAVVGHMADIIEKRKLDYLAIAGDLFHVSPPFAEAFNWMYERVKTIAQMCPVILIAGNHDLRSLYYSGDMMDIPFLKFAEIPNVHVLGHRGVNRVEVAGVTITGFHHQHLDRLSDELKNAEPADILLLHQSVAGAALDNGFRFPEGVTPGSDVMSKFGLTVCGHIHKPQHLTGSFLIPGSPIHINFGDESTRYFWIRGDDGKLEYVKTNVPKFITVGDSTEVKEDGNHYRVDITKTIRAEKLSLPENKDAVTGYCDRMKVDESYLNAGLEVVTTVPVDQVRPSDFIIESVNLVEFGPFEKASFDVTTGLHMVLGEGVDVGSDSPNPGLSNGSGKSTLFEGISWVLYGRTAKGIKGGDVVRRNRKKSKTCSGTLVMRSETRGELVIKRTQKAKGSGLSATLNGDPLEGKNKEVQADLIETLGVDYDFFRQFVYYGQREATFFSQMGDADRKQMTSRMIGLGWYNAALAVAKSKLESAQSSLSNAEQALTKATTESAVMTERLKSLRAQQEDWKVSKARRLDEATQIVQNQQQELSGLLVANKADLADLRATIEVAREQLTKSLQAEIDGLEASVRASFDSRRMSLRSEVDRASQEHQAAVEALSQLREPNLIQDEIDGTRLILDDVRKVQAEKLAAMTAARQDVKRAQAELVEKQQVLSGAKGIDAGARCSRCGAAVTEETKAAYLGHLIEEAETLANRIKMLETSTFELNEQWAEANEAVAKYNSQLDSLNVEQSKREAVAAKVEPAAAAVERASRQLESIESDIASAIALRKAETDRRHASQVESFEANARSRVETLQNNHHRHVETMTRRADEAAMAMMRIQKEVCPLDQQFAEVSSRLMQIESDRDQLEHDMALDIHNADIWAFWVKGFGREGIPAALLGGFCEQFTAEANAMLGSFNTSMTVSLLPSTTIKSGEVRDRLDYTITTRTGASSYDQLSGGEKVRVDVASMLTLHEMAARQYAINGGLFGILILDEVFKELDAVGCELVYQMIESFDARSVWVISHNDAMKALFRDVMTVRNLGDKSVLLGMAA